MRVFNLVRQASRHEDDDIVAVAELAFGSDPEPLCPRDCDKICRKTSARYLLRAFD